MSIWGVDQSLANAVIVTAGSDVACSAGAETNVLSGTVTVGTQGANIQLTSDMMGYVVLGATPPTAMVIAARVGAGADYDTWTVAPAALVANAVLPIYATLSGIFARGALAAGSTINMTVNPTGQAVTFKATGRVVHSAALAVDV